MRAFYERLMNLVYFIETCEDLEKSVSKRVSKLKKFDKFTKDNPSWAFLGQCTDRVRELDDDFRGPETHKGSPLRKHIFDQGGDDPSLILGALIDVLNVLLPGLARVLADDGSSPRPAAPE